MPLNLKETLSNLELEMDKMKREMDTDYKLFISKKEDFNLDCQPEIRCVFCNEDSPNYTGM